MSAAGRFSDEHVSKRFFEEYPEERGTWVPVSEKVEGRLSPQSGKVLQALNFVYGGLDTAWNAGWRWMLLPMNHQWYPPSFDDDADYTALVKKVSRGGKNKGSLTSPKAREVLKACADLM